MTEYYFTTAIDETRMLCLSPLTSRRLAHADVEVPEELGGYFLYEQEGNGDNAPITIMAHVLSDDAVDTLRSMFQMK